MGGLLIVLGLIVFAVGVLVMLVSMITGGRKEDT